LRTNWKELTTVSRNGEKTLKLKAATDCLETNATALLSGPGPMIFPEAVNRECDVSRPDHGEVRGNDSKSSCRKKFAFILIIEYHHTQL